MLKYSPLALVLVLIAIAIAWDAAEPEEERFATRPLEGDYREPPRRYVPPPPDPMPELPVYDPEVDDPDFRARNVNHDYELHDEMARTLAGGSADVDEEDIREVLNADLPGADDPATTSRRLLATLNRRRQQLGLVQRLLDQVLPEIQEAQDEGNDERAEWLEQTRERLETRRDAIVESIVAMADTDEDVLRSNADLRTALEDIRGFRTAAEPE